MTNKILILYAHEQHDNSQINRSMVEAIKDLDGITLIDLYREYSDFKIDQEIEIQRLFEHNIIIFQFPMHWFSTPAILKEYQDRVILADHAYSTQGKAFEGKYFFCATSTGGAKSTFEPDGRNNYTLLEFLRPQEQTMRAVGMTYLPPFVINGAATAKEEGRLIAHVEGWSKLLVSLRDGNLDMERAIGLAQLNDY